MADLLPARGRRVLVPTMGALHSGHAALIRRAVEIGDEVIVSVYVNPSQFLPGEDYEKYPRTPESDVTLAEAAGADVVFMPSSPEVYPAGSEAVVVHIGHVGDQWEGANRPGHFDGVATVVAKLFGMVRPDAAVFGRKDLQQCAVVRRLISELHMPVELDIIETIREPDGLALSSRNAYLSTDERASAPQLHASLLDARQRILDGGPATIQSTLTHAKHSLSDRFDVDYLALVSSTTMDETSQLDVDASLIIAARLGVTRLIDNLSINSI